MGNQQGKVFLDGYCIPFALEEVLKGGLQYALASVAKLSVSPTPKGHRFDSHKVTGLIPTQGNAPGL